MLAQELGGARCDALAKHLEVNRAEKAALAARCDELAADVAALQDDVAAAERRCESAEATVDAIAKVCSFSKTRHETTCIYQVLLNPNYYICDQVRQDRLSHNPVRYRGL